MLLRALTDAPHLRGIVAHLEVEEVYKAACAYGVVEVYDLVVSIAIGSPASAIERRVKMIGALPTASRSARATPSTAAVSAMPSK